MFLAPTKPKPPTTLDPERRLVIQVNQKRERMELFRRQLERDGIAWDDICGMWIEAR
jgi:hypothetical protein